MYLKTLLLIMLLFLCCAASPLDLIPKYQVCPKGATSITEYYYDSTQWVEEDPLNITQNDSLDIACLSAIRELPKGTRSYTSIFLGDQPTTYTYSYKYDDNYNEDTVYISYRMNDKIDTLRHKGKRGSRHVMARALFDTLTIKLYDDQGVHYGDSLYTKYTTFMGDVLDTLFVSYTYNPNSTINQKEYYSIVKDQIVSRKTYTYDIQSITEEYFNADSTGELKLYESLKLSFGDVFTLESLDPAGDVFKVIQLRHDSLNRLAELTTFEPKRNKGRKAVYNYDEPTPLSQGSQVVSSNATVQVQVNKLIYNSPSLQEGGTYVLYSIDGQVLKTGNVTGTTLTVSLAGLSKGLYLCKVKTKHHSEAFKVEY